ncbi:phage tail protein [Paenibacillus aquistagni]|uniref:phage tail protein n=1 Tax=Paenibacillus aquistagni TaxID=1852522 RepID=UPI00145B6DE5|nr:tail fiber protein [Paenibacillus aquistagni]NMM54551.1 phage tail protein [Paenibacillus aquistagni]
MDPYLGEIRIFAGQFAPKDWAFCNGQLLPISQYTALFSIIGVRYGGDGKTTFALPNLQGRAPMHFGAGPGLTPHELGEAGGSSSVTLLESEIPRHNHTPAAVSSGSGDANPEQKVWGPTAGLPGPKIYSTAEPNVPMNPAALSQAGSSQPHNNMQPYLGINFIISLAGVYPPRS